jgi:tetratricopeptide (TPR) repeat protein
LKAGNVLQKWLLHEKAIQLYELAFKPTPKLFEVKIKMALSYLYLKEYQKAKDCLDEA